MTIIVLDPPPEEEEGPEEGGRRAAPPRTAQVFDSTTRDGLRAARRRINQLIDERFPDTVDEE